MRFVSERLELADDLVFYRLRECARIGDDFDGHVEAVERAVVLAGSVATQLSAFEGVLVSGSSAQPRDVAPDTLRYRAIASDGFYRGHGNEDLAIPIRVVCVDDFVREVKHDASLFIVWGWGCTGLLARAGFRVEIGAAVGAVRQVVGPGLLALLPESGFAAILADDAVLLAGRLGLLLEGKLGLRGGSGRFLGGARLFRADVIVALRVDQLPAAAGLFGPLQARILAILASLGLFDLDGLGLRDGFADRTRFRVSVLEGQEPFAVTGGMAAGADQLLGGGLGGLTLLAGADRAEPALHGPGDGQELAATAAVAVVPQAELVGRVAVVESVEDLLEAGDGRVGALGGRRLLGSADHRQPGGIELDVAEIRVVAHVVGPGEHLDEPQGLTADLAAVVVFVDLLFDLEGLPLTAHEIFDAQEGFASEHVVFGLADVEDRFSHAVHDSLPCLGGYRCVRLILEHRSPEKFSREKSFFSEDFSVLCKERRSDLFLSLEETTMRLSKAVIAMMADATNPCNPVIKEVFLLLGETTVPFLVDAMCQGRYGMEVADFAYDCLVDMDGCEEALQVAWHDQEEMGRYMIEMVLEEQEQRKSIAVHE